MTTNRRRMGAMGAGMLLVPLAVAADVLHLKGGGAVRGRVTEATDTVILESGPARVTYPRDLIERIEREPEARETYALRVASLRSPTAGDWAGLGAWCRDRGLEEEAHEAFAAALRLDPDHDAARRALGHVPWDGAWVTEAEFHAALGEVRFRGRWIPREEMLAVLDSEKAAREARALLERMETERRESEAADRRAAEAERRAGAEALRAEAEAQRREERRRLREEAEALRLARVESWRSSWEARDAARAQLRSLWLSQQVGGGADVWGWTRGCAPIPAGGICFRQPVCPTAPVSPCPAVPRDACRTPVRSAAETVCAPPR